MRVKKKKVSKKSAEQREEQKLQAQGDSLQVQAQSDLDVSQYSYYTERTDMNESMMTGSVADINIMSSPDKQARALKTSATANNVQVLADLETSVPPEGLNSSPSDKKSPDVEIMRADPSVVNTTTQPKTVQQSATTEITLAKVEPLASNDATPAEAAPPTSSTTDATKNTDNEERKEEAEEVPTTENAADQTKAAADEALAAVFALQGAEKKPEQAEEKAEQAETVQIDTTDKGQEKGEEKQSAEQGTTQAEDCTPSPTPDASTQAAEQKSEEESSWVNSLDEQQKFALMYAGAATVGIIVCAGAYLFMRRS